MKDPKQNSILHKLKSYIIIYYIPNIKYLTYYYLTAQSSVTDAIEHMFVPYSYQRNTRKTHVIRNPVIQERYFENLIV